MTKDSQLTINFFLQSRDFGGAEKFALDLLTELARTGENTYLYTNNPILLQELSAKQQPKVRRLPLHLDFVGNRRGLLKSLLLTPLASVYYWRTLLKIKNRKSSQVILCSGFSEKILLAPLAHLCQIPIIFIEYGPLEPLFAKFAGLPKKLYFFAKQFAKKIIVSSEKTKEALSSVFPKQQLTLVRCGSRDRLPQIKPTIKKHTVTIVSRLEKGKGQDLAIQAWQLLKDKPTDARLRIIGRGNFYPTLQKLARGDKSIELIDYVTDTTEIVAESAIILCPSVWELEGFGLVVTEAMAMAKPIIAFDRAPYNELIANERNALLAKDRDIADLAHKIDLLLCDSKLQKRLGKQARADFLTRFEIGAVAKNYLQALQN